MSKSFSFLTLVFLILGCKTPSFIFDESKLNLNLTERSVKKNINAAHNEINSLTKKGNAVFLFGNKTQGLNFNLKYKKKTRYSNCRFNNTPHFQITYFPRGHWFL